MALHKLLDDLAKAHADAAASEVNNEQRFHQLEQETVTARCEVEALTKLKEQAVKAKTALESEVAQLQAGMSAAQGKASSSGTEQRKLQTQLDEARREKDELAWAQDRRVQEAERAKAEAEEMRKRALELTQERLTLIRAADEGKDAALRAQAELNAAATRLKHLEVEHKGTSKALDDKAAELSALRASSSARIASLEAEARGEKAEAERARASAAEWKAAHREAADAAEKQLDRSQAEVAERPVLANWQALLD